MKCAISLVAVALLASTLVHAAYYYPRPSRRCCAEASQCYRGSVFNSPCKTFTRPLCNTNLWWYRPCYQGLILLRKVWARFANDKYRCCRVHNCPKIYYSRCSFTTERCPGLHRNCAPHYYYRYYLKLWCPGVGWRFTYRYFPHCCVCQYCGRPRYFPTLPGGPGK